MTKQEISAIVNDFLTDEFEIEAELLKPEATLREDLGIDSLEVVDIIVAVQSNFGFKPTAAQMKEAKTLDDFYNLIEANQQ